MTVPWPAAPAVWAVVQATTADDRKIFLVVGGLVAVALALTALTGTLPAWLNQEVRHAWAQSARPMR